MSISTSVIILSPHFDDAVLSCAHHLLKWAQEGCRVIVVSIFTKGQSNRKIENHLALKLLGAEAINLDYLDAPDRFDQALCYSNIISWPVNQELVRSLARDIEKLIAKIEPETVVGPMSLGLHVDHRVTLEALSQIQHRMKLLYEDKPYSLIPENSSLILNEKLEFTKDFWRRYFNIGYVKTLCRKEEAEDVKNYLESYKSNNKLDLKRHSSIFSNKERVDKAISCYKSQIDLLFPDRNEYEELYSLPEKLWRVISC